MQRIALTLVLAMLPFAAGMRDAAACSPRFQQLANPDVGGAGGYDPFESNPRAQTFQIRVENADDDNCKFFVTISEDGGDGRRMSGPGGELGYEFYTSATLKTPVGDIPGTKNAEVLDGDLKKNDTVAIVEYYALVAPGQTVAAGRYSEQRRFSLYRWPPANATLEDERSVTVSANVRSAIAVTFDDGGRSVDLSGMRRTLDFGQLRSGERRSFNLEVASNTPYELMLESENRGMLKHATADIYNVVPYSLTLGGQPLGLSGPVILPFTSDGRSDVVRHRFAVTIGTIDRAVAGRYADNVTITVSAR